MEAGRAGWATFTTPLKSYAAPACRWIVTVSVTVDFRPFGLCATFMASSQARTRLREASASAPSRVFARRPLSIASRVMGIMGFAPSLGWWGWPIRGFATCRLL